MHLQFLGATETVTGSKYLLTGGSSTILIDCGLFQGYKRLRLRNREDFPIDPAKIDAVILTHAHLDHSGYLPLLVKNGFKGRIFGSSATLDLCRILLPDSGRLQEEEANFANRHGYSKHAPALPLYSEADAVRCFRQFSPVDFGRRVSVCEDFTIELAHAGHILGAAIVAVRNRGTILTFSGDLGRANDLILPPPAIIEQTDYLVVESTYGNRRHDPADPQAVLAKVINDTAARGGVTIIPSFAVGRAQELMYYIHLLKESGRIPSALPVYLNSPMAVDVTHIYQQYGADHRLSSAQSEAMCRAARIVNSVEESIALNERQVPMVIIAASGMATGGRVLHHLKAFASDPRNTILFSGYQAGGTRGAAMLEGTDAIKIFGEYVPLRAQVAQIENLSAHADSSEILDWLSHFSTPPKQTFITHGEPAAADALRRKIQDTLHWRCQVPAYLDSVELN